jgi:hypothetical protein
MNNSNETVDRVLACLRDIEAPEGMDHRILRAMHARAATSSEPRRAASPLTPKFWLAATASAAIVIIAIWWSASVHRPPLHDLATNTTTTAKPNTVLAPKRQADPAAHPASPTRPQHVAASVQTQATKPAEASEPEALSDTLAASHPAPPLPLTEQEQLLIRILHKGDPVELASLNNDFRGRQTIEDTEAFQRFFKQQPSPAQNAEEQKNTADLRSDDDQSTNDDRQNIEAQPAADAQTNDIPQQ